MAQDAQVEPAYAVVDVETSGLRPGRDHVLQIAVVTVDATGAVVDRWSTLVRPRRWWHRVGPAPHPRHHPALAALGTAGANRIRRACAAARGKRVHRPQRRVRRRVHRPRGTPCRGPARDRPAGVHPRSVPAARSRSPAHPWTRRAVRPLWGPVDRPSRRPRRRHGDRSGPPPSPARPPPARPPIGRRRVTRSAAAAAWRRADRGPSTSSARRPRRPCRPAAAGARASAH